MVPLTFYNFDSIRCPLYNSIVIQSFPFTSLFTAHIVLL
jgi:hypothetical protein